ncbi:MAG: hypothetical protein C3F08_03190 [Candidatus Methylomirabilota bacterium]|nr:MAG: hypothetical protein C3F08_03190 [candidate division NC10 bacterium]
MTALKIVRSRSRVVGTALCIITALALCVPRQTNAAMVYGRILDEAGRVQPTLTFSVEDSAGKTVKENEKTDDKGGYSINLAPGIYRVKSGNKTAVIRSGSEPIRQDIHLRKP